MKKVIPRLLALLAGGIGFFVSWQFVQDTFTGVVIGGLVAMLCYGFVRPYFTPEYTLRKEVQARLAGETILLYCVDTRDERRLFTKKTAADQVSRAVLAVTDKRIYYTDQLKGTETDIPFSGIETLNIAENQLTANTQQGTQTIPVKAEWVETLVSTLQSELERFKTATT